MKTLPLKQCFNIGVIGAGWIGKTYAHAYRNLNYHKLKPKLLTVATSNISSASNAASDLGFEFYTDNWRELCQNDNVDLVCIATPINLHFAQAMYALENGKHIAIEKPIVTDLAQLKQLTEFANASNLKINVGYNYLHNPMLYYAKQLLNDQEIGDLVSFRIVHSEDFMANQATQNFKPWLIDKSAGGGVTRDIGSHPLSMINYLLGDIKSVSAIGKTQYQTRGKNIVVNVEDHIDALIDMGNGLQGTLTASWICSGRGMNLGFEIYGTKGAICFNQEKLNELEVYLVDENKPELKGGLTVRAGSKHPEFDLVCPGDEHGIGFMDLKTLEAKNLLDSIINDTQPLGGFSMGVKVEQQIDALHQSIENRAWIEVDYQLVYK